MPDLPQRPRSLLGAAVVQAVEAAGVLGASVLAAIDTGSGPITPTAVSR